MCRIFCLFFALSLCFAPALHADSTLYTWVDDRGVVHFGQVGAELPTDRKIQKITMGEKRISQGDAKKHGAVPLSYANQLPEVDVLLNGQLTTSFVIDTGSTITILNRETAESLGIQIEGLPISRRLHTADGVLDAVTIEIEALQVGQNLVQNVTAAVPMTGRLPNLLGQSFLSGFNVTFDRDAQLLYLEDMIF